MAIIVMLVRYFCRLVSVAVVVAAIILIVIKQMPQIVNHIRTYVNMYVCINLYMYV